MPLLTNAPSRSMSMMLAYSSPTKATGRGNHRISQPQFVRIARGEIDRKVGSRQATHPVPHAIQAPAAPQRRISSSSKTGPFTHEAIMP